MKFLRIICWSVAFFLILCALAPLIYGIFHIGNAALLIFAAIIMTLPLWLRLSASNKMLRGLTLGFYSLGIVFVLGLSMLMLSQAYGKKPPTTGNYTVITLGCKVNGSYPSNMLRNRLLVTLKYLRENPDATAIMSGGQGDDEIYPEGQVMAEFLIERGIEQERIFIEDKSHNTRENLAFSKELIPSDSLGVVIVSDNFHQMRAGIVAKSLGLEPVYTCSSYSPYGLLPSYWVRDMMGVPLFWLQENVFK